MTGEVTRVDQWRSVQVRAENHRTWKRYQPSVGCSANGRVLSRHGLKTGTGSVKDTHLVIIGAATNVVHRDGLQIDEPAAGVFDATMDALFRV